MTLLQLGAMKNYQGSDMVRYMPCGGQFGTLKHNFYNNLRIITLMGSLRPFLCNLYPLSGLQGYSLVQIYLSKFLCPCFSTLPPTDRALTLCFKQRVGKLPLFTP